ncbi:MAG: electron transfer flavoprotein subunit beta/FixA family protein [Desulfatiglandaceae bacterium]|jgi:electron transfer flavoprotein beta subunit
MKILVPVKRVVDPEKANQVVISKDGSRVESQELGWKPNPFDEYAVEAALRLLEDRGTGEMKGEVLVVSLGPDEAIQQIRWCLAMGAHTGILVKAEDEALDASVVAQTLAALVKKESPDLVLMGKQTVDGESNQTAQILAEILGWPQATFAGRISAPADLSRATVTREVDGGTIDITVRFPAVISVDVRIVTPEGVDNHVSSQDKPYQEGPRYASLRGIMRAKKMPVRTYEMADLGVDTERLVNTLSFSAPPGRKAGVILETVEELVQKLKEEARVI